MKNININQMEIEEASPKNIYFSIIESLLFVSGEPIDIKQIASIIECSAKFTKELMAEMIKYYEEESRGITIIKVNESYGLVTKSKNSDYVEKLLGTNSRQSLSQAALETLAIIAYKQPITRIDIDEIRGVKSDRALTTLVQKGLIKESGRLDVPGRPILYGTTEEFLKYFGLEDLNSIPYLDDLVGDNIDEEKIED
ncbi:segregation and condensation protein B [Clostridium carboxidivorans P7]|uniref:Segregation and condensation protein B n=1 Tax=Clostridium carboxidivorans P7 TaxID=536227 RepID=C6PQP5_9CLOT|nr:SMC-Scp complex subunit ScpB [Clostridium carboxidivorans]AKN34047.1 segregation and condensation protein B [Clostridium carboxidivorans P7]EET88417.1 chromosome segregation and condensation protein, ScpB [Clostridium carboxidivorans P7]EFG88079.1 segregation and condensation protein B [Clostridium carboxidivorans P7]